MWAYVFTCPSKPASAEITITKRTHNVEKKKLYTKGGRG